MALPERTIQILSFFALLFSPLGLPAEVLRGPYLTEVTADSIRVRLEADLLLDTEVRFWPEAEPGAVRTFIASAEPLRAKVRFISAESPKVTAEREEEHYLYDVRLLGLRPGLRYRYKVLHGGAECGEGLFRTFDPKDEKIRFIAVGDVRTGDEYHRSLVAQFLSHRPLFITILGDLVPDGKVYAGWEPFFEIEWEFFRSVPLFPAWGNHDGRSSYFERYFPFPGKSYSRSFDCGPVHVLVLDSEKAEEDEVLRWIDQDLAAARGSPWKIAVYHHPTFNEGAHASAYGLAKLLPLLKTHQVDLTLTGHSHLYERTFPLKSLLRKERPIVHVVTGGGGAPLGQEAEAFYIAARSREYHFLLIEADRETLSGTAIGIDGRPFDRFTLRKPAGGAQGLDTGPLVQGGDAGEAADPRSSPTGESVVLEESVALWRGLRGSFDARARFRLPDLKDGKPSGPLPEAVAFAFKVPPSPIQRKISVSLRLDPADRDHWKLIPESDRFLWGPEGYGRIFTVEPRTAEALLRKIPPSFDVRVENVLVGFTQRVPLKMNFDSGGKSTRRVRM